MDPFAGVGTTNLAAQNLGFKSIGFDINPVATLAAQIKTTTFTKIEIKEIEKLIFDFKPIKTTEIPDSPLLKRSFSNNSFNSLMGIKGFYESIDHENIQKFFKLAYMSIIEDVSCRVKDGNGIKIAKNKKEIENVYEYYREQCRSMLKDIFQINSKAETIIIDGSILKEKYYNLIKDKKIGLVIFSPPYANCFDYCEVYKLELWMGGFVKEYSDFKKYRNLAIRSHVNSKFDHTIKNQNNSVEIVSELISCYNLWNKNIPSMIKGYFDDMQELLLKLRNLMVEDSKCFIVVANSGYKGILVPTDLLISEIAKNLGFKVNNIIYARKIRASSQQMEDPQLQRLNAGKYFGVAKMKFNNLLHEKFNYWEQLENKIENIPSTKEKGDIFEEFVFVYLNLNRNLYQISEIYMEKDIPLEYREKYHLELNDSGVDGLIILKNGKTAGYQVKFRTNRKNPSYEELAKFWAEGRHLDYHYTIANSYYLSKLCSKNKKHLSILVDEFERLDSSFF